MDPILSNAVGGIKLIVKKEDETEANELLQQFDQEYTAKAPFAQNVEAKPSSWFLNKALPIWRQHLTWLFGSYAVSAKNVYQCANPANMKVKLCPKLLHERSEYETDHLN